MIGNPYLVILDKLVADKARKPEVLRQLATELNQIEFKCYSEPKMLPAASVEPGLQVLADKL